MTVVLVVETKASGVGIGDGGIDFAFGSISARTKDEEKTGGGRH